MNQNGQCYAVYDSVPNNPTVKSVEEGAVLARRIGADFIVAIGGGSPMDAAKAIAMLARQEVKEGILRIKLRKMCCLWFMFRPQRGREARSRLIRS